MTTIFDVAKKAGVSISTVSRVINNYPYVKDSTRKRVQKLLDEMDYVPNYNASSLVRKKTKTIAVMLPDITNSFFATMFHGIEERANQNGFVVIFGKTNEEIVREEEYVHIFLERRVDGIILDPVSPNMAGILAGLSDQKWPSRASLQSIPEYHLRELGTRGAESAKRVLSQPGGMPPLI